MGAWDSEQQVAFEQVELWQESQCWMRAVIVGRVLGTSRISCAFGPGSPVRLPLRPAQPVSSVGPSAGDTTQGSPARAVASQTVSSYQTVTVIPGRRSPSMDVY